MWMVGLLSMNVSWRSRFGRLEEIQNEVGKLNSGLSRTHSPS
jgi:hypothetical protein